ncbi:MAG TPA: helix-turn-helix transcriptional regulator [Pseudonocardiaceae bacterium]|nr:helix-turn-helix transcriptional regulator [Pseudonocardiaceae bacterium]
MSSTSSTVPKRQLGMALRKHREALAMEREEPARLLDCSPSKIGRIENGDVGVKSSELRDLLGLYQVKGRERADLERLGQQSRQRRKRTTYGTALPDWFRRYVNLEEGATSVRTYDVELVPGLFQTEDYARAVTQASPLPAPADVDRLIAARMARQARVTGDDAPELHAVLSEGVLRTQVGGPDVMRAQLTKLREVARLPNVTIQICPFGAGAHAATGFPFTLLRLPNADGLDVVYLEDLTAARYIDNDPMEQQKYGLIWSYLIRAALSPAKSIKLVTTLMDVP